MLTLGSYLKKLKHGMQEIELSAQPLIIEKERLVYALNTDWNSINELIKLIEHHEIPLIDHIRTEIKELISKEPQIRRLAVRRGQYLKSIDILFNFLIKIQPSFKFLKKALRRELLALKRMNINSFMQAREGEEIPAYNRIEKHVRTTLHSLHFNRLIPIEGKREIEYVISGKPSTLVKVASIFLLLLALARPAFAQEKTFTHQVRARQNFSTIYQKYKDSTLSYEEVIKANKEADSNFDPDKIQPGQKLVFPLKQGAKAPVQQPNKYCIKEEDLVKEKEDILLARLLMGETNSKKVTEKSMIEIAYVVLERVKSKKFPNKLHDVVLSPKAFSCFNKNDRSYNKVLDPETYAPDFWKICINVARAVLAGTVKNPVPGADHYHDKSVNPSWNKKMKFIAKIDVFYFWCSTWKQLSQHFNEKEFANKARAVYVRPELVEQLEILRTLAGNNPIKIINGFRWLTEKTGETKEELKLHNAGKAADITIKNKTLQETAELAKKAGFKVKLYEKYVHVSLE